MSSSESFGKSGNFSQRSNFIPLDPGFPGDPSCHRQTQRYTVQRNPNYSSILFTSDPLSSARVLSTFRALPHPRCRVVLRLARSHVTVAVSVAFIQTDCRTIVIHARGHREMSVNIELLSSARRICPSRIASCFAVITHNMHHSEHRTDRDETSKHHRKRTRSWEKKSRRSNSRSRSKDFGCNKRRTSWKLSECEYDKSM